MRVFEDDCAAGEEADQACGTSEGEGGDRWDGKGRREKCRQALGSVRLFQEEDGRIGWGEEGTGARYLCALLLRLLPRVVVFERLKDLCPLSGGEEVVAVVAGMARALETSRLEDDRREEAGLAQLILAPLLVPLRSEQGGVGGEWGRGVRVRGG
eukprot:765319-Hanusia_phi.AAC.1